MAVFVSLIALVLASALVAFFIKKRPFSRSKNYFVENQEAEQLLKIIQINCGGVITQLKERIEKIKQKNNVNIAKQQLIRTMPTFMFEATDNETINQYDIPEEIRLALQRLRIFISDNSAITLKILKEAETIQFNDGDIIFEKGQVVNHIYLVIYGTVKLKADIFDRLETTVSLSAGDCIFSFMNIIENIVNSNMIVNVTAQADGECGIVKIPIEFLYHSSSKMKLFETAIAWTEKFKNHVLIGNLSLSEYLYKRESLRMCNCQKCDNIDELVLDSKTHLKSHLSINDQDFEDVLMNAEIFVYSMHETISDCKDSLFFLCHGSLDETVTIDGVTKRATLIHHNKNSFVAVQNMFMVHSNNFKLSVRGKNTTVFKWSNEESMRLANKYPEFLNTILKDFLSKHSDFYRAIEWLSLQIEYPRDSTIVHCGSAPNGLYTIISGRVRAVELNQNDLSPIIVEELGQGDTIGLNEAVLETSNRTSYITVRFTSIIIIPMTLFESLKVLIPSSTSFLTPLYARNARRLSLHAIGKSHNHGILSNVKTIAVVPGSQNVSSHKFSKCLVSCLAQYSSKCILLNSESINRQFNTTDINNISSYRLLSYLSYLESEYSTILMVCNETMSKWSIHALEQADVILTLLNFSEADKEPQGIEKKIMEMKFKTTREVVFLHPEITEFITGTNERLNLRKGYHQHFHIRCSESFFTSDADSIINFDVSGHFARLARFLTGNPIGLALGGGGAKGIAHIGSIQSILEKGIPIDFVSGTSIGAFIGGLWALFEDLDRVEAASREFSKALGSWISWIVDLTLPIVSLFSGHHFSLGLDKIFKKQNIEDFWTPFLSITTDLTSEQKRVYDSGPAAVYIQASMTLIGYMPPVSDPFDNHLLVDGGYTDLNPVADLLSRGCNNVYGVVVSADSIGRFKGNHGRSLSGFWALLSRFNPLSAFSAPTFLELQYHLGFICASNAMQNLLMKQTGITLIRPDLQKYSTMSFKHFDSIKMVGKKQCDLQLAPIKCVDCNVGMVNCKKCHNNSIESLA